MIHFLFVFSFEVLIHIQESYKSYSFTLIQDKFMSLSTKSV